MNIDQEMWHQWHILDFGAFYPDHKGNSGFLELYLAIFDTLGGMFSLDMKKTGTIGQNYNSLKIWHLMTVWVMRGEFARGLY